MGGTKNLFDYNSIKVDELELLNSFDGVKKKFKSNEIIYDYNKTTNMIGVVVSGKCKLFKIDIDGNEHLLELLTSGSFFGSILIHSQNNEGVYVKCVTACEVVFINKDKFNISDSKNEDFWKCSLNLILGKLFYLSRRIEVLANKSIRDKLLAYVDVNCQKNKSNKFEMDMNLTCLAEYLNVDRSAMMREIKSLKEQGIIEIKGKQVKKF